MSDSGTQEFSSYPYPSHLLGIGVGLSWVSCPGLVPLCSVLLHTPSPVVVVDGPSDWEWGPPELGAAWLHWRLDGAETWRPGVRGSMHSSWLVMSLWRVWDSNGWVSVRDAWYGYHSCPSILYLQYDTLELELGIGCSTEPSSLAFMSVDLASESVESIQSQNSLTVSSRDSGWCGSCKWNQIRDNVGEWINVDKWLFASCCGNKAGKIWDVSEVHRDKRMKASQRQIWKLNLLPKLDTGHGSSYSLSGVGIVGVYRRLLGWHDSMDVKGRWYLGMGGKWGRWGSDQGLCEMRMVCVWSGGWIKLRWEGRGRKEWN